MADNAGERNGVSLTPAGVATELGNESPEGEGMLTTESNEEETSLFTLPAGFPTLKQVIGLSGTDNYRETSQKVLHWCTAVSMERDGSPENCTEELEKCLAYIMSEPSMEFVRGSPLSYSLTILLGRAYQDQSRYEDAAEMSTGMIAQVGETEDLQYFAAQAWAMLAEAHLLRKQTIRGQKAYERFFEIMLSLPDDPSWLENVERYYLLCKAYLSNHKPHETMKYSRKALQYLVGKEEPMGFINSQKTILKEYLGRALEMVGDLHGAAKCYQEALDDLNDLKDWGVDGRHHPSLYYYLGGVQKQLGHYSKAISTLEQGLVYAEQSGHVNLQFNFLLLLIEVHRVLVVPADVMPNLQPRNFIINQKGAKEALKRYSDVCRNLVLSYPTLGEDPTYDHLWDQHWEENWDRNRAEEALKFAVEKGDLQLQIRAMFFICGEMCYPKCNQDSLQAREAFEECRRCLKAWDSQHGGVVNTVSEDLRLRLAWYAISLDKGEEAEEILKVLLRSYEPMLDRMFTAGDASEELVVDFQESTKAAIIAMMRTQLYLASRDLSNSRASSLMPSASRAGVLNTLKALMWSERARARTALFRLAPGFHGLINSLQPGDVREFEGIFFPDPHNLPYDNPEALLESLSLNNDPLLDVPGKPPKKLDPILFNVDDSYALNFIGHAVRDSKTVFVEYFILGPEELLIIVFKAGGSLMDDSQSSGHLKQGISHELSIGISNVDVTKKLDDDDMKDALMETQKLSQTVTSGFSSDTVSVMNANRFYVNDILTGLVAKSQRLVIEVQEKLKRDEYGTDIKDEEEEIDMLYGVLYDLLIAPIEKYLENIPSSYNLVIIPHEDMGVIPFGALTNHSNQALIERFAITIAPSIFCVRLCKKLYENKVSGGGGELLVGREDGYPEGWLPLGNAHAEVQAVQEFCQSAISITDSSHVGSDGNMKNAVKECMQKASWLHFTTHGQVSKEFPRGSLLLGRDDSSRLTADEIGRAGPLSARAAVLSACQTALGSIRGEGILGFARAFILAGVPITILSMWEVRGSYCFEFMKQFYSALCEGLDVPHAMQKVILAMKKEQQKFRSRRIQITKRKWRVSDWAAFACYGYPGVRFTTEKGKDIAPPWLSQYHRGKGPSGSSSSASTS